MRVQRQRRLTLAPFFAVCISLLIYRQVNAAAQFIPLGFLPNGNDFSFANGVSNGGTLTVVGYANTTSIAREAFVWTQSTGMVGLGGSSAAQAVSQNGTVVAGENLGGVGTAWRWTSATGKVTIGSGEATAISADGSVIAGDNNDAGFRWTAATGSVPLPIPPGASSAYSPATGISANGLYICGQAATPTSGQYKAYIYDSTNGYTTLPNSHTPTDDASFVSNDRQTAIGYCNDSPNTAMAIWKNGVLTTQVNSLGSFSGLLGVAASADGSYVVGSSFQRVGSAFIWDASHGARLLQSVLTNDYGLDLTGWQLTDATGISEDGLAITGYGTDPQGYTEAFVAIIPEPNTALTGLLCTGLLLLGRHRRREGVKLMAL